MSNENKAKSAIQIAEDEGVANRLARHPLQGQDMENQLASHPVQGQDMENQPAPVDPTHVSLDLYEKVLAENKKLMMESMELGKRISVAENLLRYRGDSDKKTPGVEPTTNTASRIEEITLMIGALHKYLRTIGEAFVTAEGSDTKLHELKGYRDCIRAIIVQADQRIVYLRSDGEVPDYADERPNDH